MRTLPQPKKQLVVEDYCKWYDLWLISPGFTVEAVSYTDLEDCCVDNESPWHDHTPNPDVIERYCDLHDIYLDERTIELIDGRWVRDRI